MTPLNAAHGFETASARARWNRSARAYDLLTWPMEALLFGATRTRLLSFVRGPRVLEVGVGTGRNLPFYAPGLHVDAIDLSSRMLERARLHARPALAGLTIGERGIYNTPQG